MQLFQINQKYIGQIFYEYFQGFDMIMEILELKEISKMNLVKKNDHVHSARSNRSRCWLITFLFCLHRINLADWFPKSKEFANWFQRYQRIKALDVFHSYKYPLKAFVFLTSSKLNICVFVYLWRVCICVEIKFVHLNLCEWASVLVDVQSLVNILCPSWTCLLGSSGEDSI